MYSVEALDDVESPPCECCGTATRTVWGLVARNGDTRVAYYVRWTPSHPEHGARFDLILGRWGEGASPSDRFAVMLECNLLDENRSFMVRDADSKRTGDLAARHLRREDVIGTPVAAEVFEIIDYIWLHDLRIAALHPPLAR